MEMSVPQPFVGNWIDCSPLFSHESLMADSHTRRLIKQLLGNPSGEAPASIDDVDSRNQELINKLRIDARRS